MRGIKYFIRRKIFKVYVHLKYPLPLWRFFNREGVKKFEEQKPELDALQQRVLDDLTETGIAVTNLDELFPEEGVLADFQAFAREREQDGSTNHKKKFLEDYWNECAELDLNNIFLRKALSERIVDIANSYLGMYSALTYFTLQNTIPSDLPLQHSQNWHRDPQEKMIVKVFCYLNDVDMDAGPFTYVKHSAPGYKKYGHLFPQEIPAGSYPDGKEVEKRIPKEDWSPMVGKAGTVIFCNTNGLHFGGVARKSPRLMSTFGYAAKTYRENPTYKYGEKFKTELTHLSPQAQFAIRAKWQSE